MSKKKEIYVYHTHTEIRNYELGEEPVLEKSLSLWSDTKFMYEPIGYMYDEDNKVLYIPRGYDISKLEYFFDVIPEIVYKPDPYDEMSMRVTIPPRDDVQVRSIGFLLGEGEYAYTKKYSQLLLNLPPGKGKTYISAAAMSFFRMKTMIVTHTKQIRGQWIDTFNKATDLPETSLCVISGSATIEALMKIENPKYKVYLITHGTITSYGKHKGWNAVRALFKHLKIGLKIVDEAHLFFANMIKLDLYSNCKKNIYLTATFDRSDYKERKLFNLCTKNVVGFSIDPDDSDAIRKHIVYLSVFYNSHPSLQDKAEMITMRKFNINKYSGYIGRCDKALEVIDYCVKFFSKKEGKILILTATTNTCSIIREYIKDKYDKVVSEYHSGVDTSEKEKAFDADIICSTSKSAGTGTDIPGLRVVINTEAYSSRVTADQVSGRLREYSPTKNTYYVELVDRGFTTVYNMYKKRLPVFKEKCTQVLTLDYDNPRPQSTF